jgi:hypothetical protein
MDSSAFRWLLPAACALTALATFAAPADPLDASAPVPPLVHRSTLDSYRNLAESPPLNWREANDTVGSVGGWRAYAREASAAETQIEAATQAPLAAPLPGRPAPAAAPALVPAPARSPGNGGHSMH